MFVRKQLFFKNRRITSYTPITLTSSVNRYYIQTFGAESQPLPTLNRMRKRNTYIGFQSDIWKNCE